MEQIKYFIYSTLPYTAPHYMPLSQLSNELIALQKIAYKAINETEATHVVYAVKRYRENEEIEQIDFYNPPVCLNDKDFYERIQAEIKEHPNCLIYAIHKHK